MRHETDDLRIRGMGELISPARLMADLLMTDAAAETVYQTRQQFIVYCMRKTID